MKVSNNAVDGVLVEFEKRYDIVTLRTPEGDFRFTFKDGRLHLNFAGSHLGAGVSVHPRSANVIEIAREDF